MSKPLKEVMDLVIEVACKGIDYGASEGETSRMEYLNKLHEAEEIVDSKLRELLPEWRLIDTAPKDGTPILVLDSIFRRPWHYECEWNGIGWYHGFGDGWPDANPTHWMPLPQPPETP